ncbi:MAG: hypothetical protein OSJ38_09550 [Lachnospiraceae bacterium]|jgi:hypothetical protein|nr:hypothetical protein [Lachnospiraceae bacterium]MCX4347478.1 hypothetical protein [Lachnospiraceae bacterium]
MTSCFLCAEIGGSGGKSKREQEMEHEYMMLLMWDQENREEGIYEVIST